MRISDWSSDVCSSDLTGVRRPLVRLEGRELAVEAQQCRRHQWLAGEEAGVVQQEARREIVRAVRHEVVAGDDLHDVAGIEPGAMEIGRASCRERVCQYV